MAIVLICIPLFTHVGHADETNDGEHLSVDVPIVEVPWVKTNGIDPLSMRQSLGVTAALYDTMHWAIALLFRADERRTWSRILERSTILAADYLTFWFPGSFGWMHEEWHRAVMSRRGVAGHNTYYDYNLFASTILINNVDDAHMERLKRDHPADMVRLSSAGAEAQYELVTALEINEFFHGRGGWNSGVIFLAYFFNSDYMYSSTRSYSDDFLEAANADENEVHTRDVLGMDFTAWTYDLFRPNDPYSARGPHPSGNGIDRYVKFADLGDEEQKFLFLQTYLSLLNFLDPMLWGYSRFTMQRLVGGRSVDWMITPRHELTPFGYTLALQSFVSIGDVNVFGRFDLYINQERLWPGIDLTLIRYPLGNLFDTRATVDVRLAGWLQPEDQMFRARRPAPGGLVGVRLSHPIAAAVGAYIEVEAKSDGWVPGNVYLDKNVSFLAGITIDR